MAEHNFDVAIIGAGCAGLWLAHGLSQVGIGNVLIDAEGAQFASLKNQGWLHTGSLYHEDFEVGHECKISYQFLRNFAPHAVSSDVNCYYLFENVEQLRAREEHCSRLQVPHWEVDALDLYGLADHTFFTRCMRVADCPVDPSAVLRLLEIEAKYKGTHVVRIDPSQFGTLLPERTPAGWRISTDGTDAIRAKVVVLSCGAYIPNLVAALGVEAAGFKRSKHIVMVVKEAVLDSMILCVDTDIYGGPNVVPIVRNRQIVGATVCLAGFGKQISESENILDDTVPDLDRQSFGSRLRYFLPGLADRVDGRSVDFYYCQKVSWSGTHSDEDNGYLASRSRVLIDHELTDGVPGLISFYPGKFTTSSVGARDCLTLVMEKLKITATVPEHRAVRG